MCIDDLGALHRNAAMCTVQSTTRCCELQKAFRLCLGLTSLLICLLFAVGSAQGHPVSQGALDLVIFPDRITIRATVSNEEVLIVAARNERNPLSYPDAVHSHGDYLLTHLHVTADRRVLDGRVVNVPKQTTGRLTYELEYRLPDVLPARIEVQEDVLREFEFAPGNPWEASYVVRIAQEGQPAAEGLLLTYRQPVTFDCHWQRLAGTATASRIDHKEMATAFVRHGIFHILTGYDHLLFVGALLLAVATLWDLVKVVSAFTLAHTITLALSALDVFRLPGTIVEPMIAASIVFVAAQNIFWPQRSRGWSRLLVAFLFGLFHGLGFAGGLLDALSGMPATTAAVAIAAFSAGVEIGHQVVVLPVFSGLHLLRRVMANSTTPDEPVRRYGSVMITLLGMIYLVSALR